MPSPRLSALLCAFTCTVVSPLDLRAQQLVSPVIEQSRILKENNIAPASPQTNADGMALPSTAATDSSDDSFGIQEILKSRPRIKEFAFASDISVIYTNNVALTHRNTISDAFLVANVSGSWSHQFNPQLALQVGLRSSFFRYNKTRQLDFEGVGDGAGLIWAPNWSRGIVLGARYDFTELLDSHSREILRDHEFTLSANRAFVFGRAHALTIGLLGSAGISNPAASQRDQLAMIAAYHVALSRHLQGDLSYRIGGFFYTQGGRNDLNQFLNLSLNYQISSEISVAGFFSVGDNESTVPAFSYQVLTGGGGLAVQVLF